MHFLYNAHPQLRVSQLRFLLYVRENPNQSLTEISTGLGRHCLQSAGQLMYSDSLKKEGLEIYPWDMCRPNVIPWMTV